MLGRSIGTGFLILAVSLAIAGTSKESFAETKEEMIAAANALDASFLAAFNAGDAAGMSKLFWKSDDTVMFPPGELMAKGAEAIQKCNAEAVAAMAGAKLVLTESHQIPMGDVVVGWGLWKATMPAPDGSTMEMVGRYTDIKAKRDGKWVYILDHASVPLPPPPAGD